MVPEVDSFAGIIDRPAAVVPVHERGRSNSANAVARAQR